MRRQLASGGAGVDPTSKLMLTILAGVATWEREIMLERQASGPHSCGTGGRARVLGRPCHFELSLALLSERCAPSTS